MIHLMNCSMMTNEGTYTKEIVSKETFRDYFNKLVGDGVRWKSYIGYPSTQSMLSDLLDVYVKMSRDNTVLEDGDRIMAVRLTSRL